MDSSNIQQWKSPPVYNGLDPDEAAHCEQPHFDIGCLQFSYSWLMVFQTQSTSVGTSARNCNSISHWNQLVF